MRITFDFAKDVMNRRKHKISLARAGDFDFEAAWITPDTREDYGELRYRAVSFLDRRLYTLVFTDDEGEAIRAISSRKASKPEIEEYAVS